MNPDNQPNTVPDIEKLKSYIQQQLHAGLQPDEVANHLRQAGWPEEHIGQAFQLVQAQVMPSTVAPVPHIPDTSHTEVFQAVQQTTPEQPSQQPDYTTTKKRGRIKTGWLLLKQSLKLLRSHESLTRYVIVSAVFSLMLAIIFTLIFIVGRNSLLTSSLTNGTQKYHPTPVGYIVVFVYYVLAFFVVNLYSAGLAANVLDLFQGNSKPYSQYMHKAWSRGGTLFVFSLIEATIGLILRLIAERSKILGRIIIWILGALWSIARLFVIPIIVSSDDENAFGAIKKSTLLLKATWGENIVGRVTFGGILLLIYVFILFPVSLALIFLGSVVGHLIGALIAIVLIIIVVIVFAVVTTAASSILNTTLFYYAQYKQIPPAFDAELLNSVFIHRKGAK